MHSKSLQVVASPCWEMAFPGVISAILVWVLGPLPRDVLLVLMLASSQQTTASPHLKQVRHANIIAAMQLQRRGSLRGCSHSFMFRLPYSLGPPGCTYRYGFPATEQPGRLHHAMNMWLPYMNCDIATCPTRATDTVGLSPTGLRPYRPLP